MNKKTKNPIIEAQNIEKSFSEYIESTFQIRDPEYDKLFKNELSKMKESLYRGPYLCSSLPFETGMTIKEMIEAEGFHLHPKFIELGGIKEALDMQLYNHQIQAIKKIEDEKRSFVISTGTGSGKTECFLYPIFDSLIKEIEEKEEGYDKPGVRAIFLFPMNSLVNDQIDRVREYLKGYKKITFGFFTGETPEKNVKNNEFQATYGGAISDNELVSREEMRNNPPHILFTNYSMLEYLLLRPQDSALISETALKYWRYVVLDEAHTYRGSLGIEISLLLRRLTGVAKKIPQFILTSATLGKGKQDIDKILEFAKTLTSSHFEKEDVIFAKRIELNKYDVKYKIKEEDYQFILKSPLTDPSFKTIFEKYVNYNDSLSLEENVFNLLSADERTHLLYSITRKEKEFWTVCDSLNFSDYNSLVALIELVSMAISPSAKKLFDVKYHMFVKAPDGAFITLGNNKKLSLLTCRNIDGMKAFKIGICQNCKTPYIIGRVENGVLCIDDDADIDEEYIEKINKVGYYLIAECLSKDEIDDIENNHTDDFTKYKVCPKCGSIRLFNDAKAKKCDCSEEEVVLYKYSEHDDPNDELYSNNIKKCPICDYQTKNGGVVLGFHIGKDRATALLAQILYRSMDYPLIEDKSTSLGMFKKEITYKNGVKQFIAFSDARQQAAFFNKFLNTTDLRFLKKALIWDVLKDPKNNHKPISYSDLVVKLTNKFQSSPIEYEPGEAIKHATSAALYELLNVDGRNSAEGLGIFAFKLDLPDNYYDDFFVEEFLRSKGFNIKADEFRILTQICLNVFRTVPAIKYPQLTVDKNELDDLLGYRKFVNYVKLFDNSGDPKIHSFLPKSGGENKIVKFIEKVLNCDLNSAKKFLQILYESAIDAEIIESNKDGLNQIDSQKYSVHSYKEEGIKFYVCDKCRKLTLYNVRNTCPEGDCDGHLHECDPDEIFSENYYRKEYMNRPLERVVTREHTAQIKSDEAKKIQNDFKNKKINIISCSTTFEMGIDLGSLSTVFMRNIPPTPANYVQRAGRAGRRAETSAFILTFCGVSSHDYTFFDDPSPMIEGIVDPPYFKIENEKIIIRHIAASALSFYFKLDNSAFQNIEVFLNNDHINKFLEYVNTKPKELGDYIDNYLLKTPDLINAYGNFKWLDIMESTSKSALLNMKEGIEDSIKTYNLAIKELNEKKPAKYWIDVAAYEEALNKLRYKNSLITYFARYNVIPGYGFPIDNVTLKIFNYQKGDFDDKYDLSRDLAIAISEYAPESEIIVDGKKYTSRYIFTPYPKAPHLKSYYIKCPHCDSYNVFSTKTEINSDSTCYYCNNTFKSGNKPVLVQEFIRPTRGFVADYKNKETHQIKPARTYASEIIYIGKGKNSIINPINVSDVITVSEFKNEELLVLNENPFYYCPTCGYTVLDKKAVTNCINKSHRNHKGIPCEGDNKLYLTHFGHSFKTDVIKLEFNGIAKMMDYECAVSTLYAILEGLSMKFNIERNDIGGMVFNSLPNLKPYEIILFDTVPGGAGHVKKLEDELNIIEVLKAAYKKVNPTIPCCDEDVSCYNCLRNFSNQRIHKHLKRGLAKDTLLDIISAIENKSVSMAIESISLDLNGTDLLDFLSSGYVDDDCVPLLKDLFNKMNSEVVYKPTGYGVVIKSGNGKIYNADFLWKDKNILLFTPSFYEDYRALSNHQSKFDCYMLDNSFDLFEFIKKIRR